MTPILRKYHRIVWFFMAGLLPVLFIAAILALPKDRLSQEVPNYQPKPLPMVVETAASSLFNARLREEPATGEQQLEIELLRPLTNAAALIYITKSQTQEPGDGVLLGTIASQNVYRFKVGHEVEEHPFILLFDPIKSQAIQTLRLANAAASTKTDQ